MSATSPPAERLKPVEGNLQYVEEKSSYATQREQDGIARRQGKQVREKRMFEKLLKQVFSTPLVCFRGAGRDGTPQPEMLCAASVIPRELHQFRPFSAPARACDETRGL